MISRLAQLAFALARSAARARNPQELALASDIEAQEPKEAGLMTFPNVTIGPDVGDRYSQVIGVD